MDIKIVESEQAVFIGYEGTFLDDAVGFSVDGRKLFIHKKDGKRKVIGEVDEDTKNLIFAQTEFYVTREDTAVKNNLVFHRIYPV